MSDDWADFARAIGNAEGLISWEKPRWHLDGIPMEVIDSGMQELKFLFTFLEYTHAWSDASSSHHSDLDSLFIKVRAAVIEFKEFLAVTPFRRLGSSEILSVFTSLNQKIALLKEPIRAAYQPYPFSSTQSFHLRSPTQTVGWNFFCGFLTSNLGYLSEWSLGDTLRLQMKALEGGLKSLCWLLLSGDCKRSPWKENMMAHFGGMVVKVAHLCCCYWYNYASVPEDNQSWEFQDMAICLEDLSRKMNLDSPEFLDTTLGFLGQYDGRHSEESISSFLHYIVGIQETRQVLHKELVTLLTCFIKIPEIRNNKFSVFIKDVVVEARFLENDYLRNDSSDYAILLATIWFLKTQIFIMSGTGGTGTLLTLSMDDHVKALREGCVFLEQLFPGDEESNQILEIFEGAHKQVKSLCQSSCAEDRLVHIKVSYVFFKSLVLIKLLKANALLLDLLEEDAGVTCLVKHKFGTLHEGISFVLQVLIDKTKENVVEDEELILTDIELVAAGVMSLCYTFPADCLTEGVQNMDIWLFDLLEKVQLLKAKVKGLYLQMPRFNLPKIPGLCFIELLLQNLRDLLNHKPDSVAHATHQIESICRDLELIVPEFQDVFEQGVEKHECKDLYTLLVGVAYQVEHVIDLMLVENSNSGVWQHYMWLYNLSDEIKHIKMQLTNFDGNNNYDDGIHNVRHKLMPIVPQASTATIEKDMVGLNDHKEEIVDRLARGTLQRDVVSIVGMAGIGKTTLANNVFCSPSVMCHFRIRAWCCVSQNYRKRDLLIDILSHIISVTDSTRAMSNEDLDLMLYRHLKGKRYLIVMDDMLSIRAWEDLHLSFPDDSNGSRILLTSRNQDEVSKISVPHPLRLLSEEESWTLLKIRVFHKEECPEELLEIGKKIAKNCKGLPLAVATIAGLLQRTCGKSPDLWKQIAESVCSRIVNDPETQCKNILELSYSYLPDHLKACLLYFGAFPKEKDILVSRLQWLWIAEGFLHKLGPKSLEDLAEDYLMDLVGRSLVIVAKRRSNGKVKACRVHDVVRELCLSKAKGDRFFSLISANDEPYLSLDSLEYGVLYEHFKSSNSVTYEQYRLYLCVDREQFVVSRPSGPFVRTLIFSATSDMSPRCSYDVAFISDNFKCLRVLDLESINMGIYFANGIESLVHLRYLAVCGDMESIPPFLSKLQNLETLIVKSLKRKVLLPDTIWRMKKLRHLHVGNHAIFTLPDDKNGGSFQLDSLVTLSLPYFSLGEETNEIIMKFPNLRKLKCIFFEPKDFSMKFCLALESLRQLVSLKISYYGKALNSGELNLPLGLKKLTLSTFCLSFNQISKIGRLQNLEVLKLISCAFEGSSWDTTEGEFLKLKYLELDNPNIVRWDACSDHLPQLQQLVLRNCKQLEEVPFDFVSISTLEKIEVQLCGNSVNESVRKIEQEEIEGLKIVIDNLHSA